tara:strand:- start:394 stop:642 length:249 start_codon:yes stop_codon:yes gene_type:complete
MAKKANKTKIAKVANLKLENQAQVFRAARRGRTGGRLIAPSLKELKALCEAKGWSGDIKVKKVFISASDGLVQQFIPTECCE